MVTYLVDSSVWVEFFRRKGTPAGRFLRERMAADPTTLLGCAPVRMELAIDPDDLRRHRTLKVYEGLLSAGISEDDFDLAAALYRAVRQTGHTIRSRPDTLVAAIALRVGARLVHNDADFDRIAEVATDLAVLRLPGH